MKTPTRILAILATSALMLPASGAVSITSILREVRATIDDGPGGGAPITSVISSPLTGNFSNSVSVNDPSIVLVVSAFQNSTIDVVGGDLQVAINNHCVMANRSANPLSFDQIDNSYSLIDVAFSVTGSNSNFVFNDGVVIDDQSAQAAASYSFTLFDVTNSTVIQTGSLSTTNPQQGLFSQAFSVNQTLLAGNDYRFTVEEELSGKMANSNQSPVSVCIPEPSSLGLALLGGLAAFRRRRR